jgi:hypothetical protein
MALLFAVFSVIFFSSHSILSLSLGGRRINASILTFAHQTVRRRNSRRMT